MPLFIKLTHSTSKYNGVSWSKNKNKWQAQLAHNKKRYHGAYFDNEKHAAMSVNLLCDKCEIERKNPTIIIKPDVIYKVMYSLSILHGKVK